MRAAGRLGLIERRIGLLFGFFLVLLVAAGARAAWLGVVRGGSLGERARSQQVSDVEVAARRGSILDRNGVELAVSQTADDVAVNPRLVRRPAAMARLIAPLLRRDAPSVQRDLTTPGTGFVYLARGLPAARARKLQQLGLRGLSYTPTSRRSYPQDWLASQLIGAVGVDGERPVGGRGGAGPRAARP